MTNNNDTLPDKEKKEAIKQDNFSLKDEKKEEGPAQKPNFALRALLLLILFLVGVGAGVYFLPTLKERLPVLAKWIGENDTIAITALNEKISSQQLAINQLAGQTADQERRLNQLSNTPDLIVPSDLEGRLRSEEHTSELQSPSVISCRLCFKGFETVFKKSHLFAQRKVFFLKCFTFFLCCDTIDHVFTERNK